MLITLPHVALFLAGPPPARSAPDPRHSLMPVPASLDWREGRFRIDSEFGVRMSGGGADPRLRRAVVRFDRRIEALTGLRHVGGTRGLTLRVTSPGQKIQSPTEDESYTLDVSPAGATLRAPTTVGALRGLETFLQLVQADAGGWSVPAVRIADRPRFPWRGLLIDVARHWEPPEVIKRQLDGMAAVKLNVLHWHLSEDQGFRVESKRYPRLQERGSDGLYYTQAQIREIVAFARNRGIRVVPEFDMPGHATAWFAGYPEYASAPGRYSVQREFGVFGPVFDPTREETFKFLDGFIAEMGALFPDRYWHIGGDEVVGTQWQESRRVKTFMRQKHLTDKAALQAYFNRRLSAILTRHGKRMVGWDEILHRDLPTTTIVQSWRGQESLDKGARQGYSGILSAGYYLDHMQTAEFHYLVDPLPAGNRLTPAQQRRVLGGEACMWGEHITPASIDSRIWPRLAAIAERFWSPREVNDVPDMYRRLAVMRGRLEALGLGSEGHTAQMVARITGGRGPAQLLRLLALTEPVHFWERAKLQQLTQETPLVFIVDAARPDPPAQWYYRSLVLGAEAGGPEAAGSRRALAQAFAEWPGFDPDLDELGREVPLVREALPAAQALARVAAIGTEALDYLERRAAPPEWAKARLAELDTLQKPQGLLRLTVIPAIRMLVEGSGPK
jgi:hexosaminidase